MESNVTENNNFSKPNKRDNTCHSEQFLSVFTYNKRITIKYGEKENVMQITNLNQKTKLVYV